jgi:hypothetical protein
MSWSCSLELVEEFRRQDCLDIESCARLKEIRTVEKSSWLDRKTGQRRPTPSGMMLEPLTASLGVERWRSSLEDSRVSPSAKPGNKKQPTTTETSGPIISESYARYDRESSSWRTFPDLFGSTCPASWETWPKQGTIQNGVCWERTMLEPLTYARDSGSMLWPTPQAHDAKATKRWREDHQNDLTAAVFNSHRIIWPTPTANEDAAGTPNGKMQPMLGNHPEVRGTTPEEWSRGSLNPLWVEWLMGWPIGWTKLEPLGTGKSRSATPQLGGISKEEVDE